MKKTIIAVMVIGLVSVGGYLGIMAMRPGARVCRQIASLCGGAKEAANTCVSNMEEIAERQLHLPKADDYVAPLLGAPVTGR